VARRLVPRERLDRTPGVVILAGLARFELHQSVRWREPVAQRRDALAGVEHTNAYRDGIAKRIGRLLGLQAQLDRRRGLMLLERIRRCLRIGFGRIDLRIGGLQPEPARQMFADQLPTSRRWLHTGVAPDVLALRRGGL